MSGARISHVSSMHINELSDIAPTKHGGSEAYDKLAFDPRWKELFKGYSFAADYREDRGHAYMLSDQDMTLTSQKIQADRGVSAMPFFDNTGISPKG